MAVSVIGILRSNCTMPEDGRRSAPVDNFRRRSQDPRKASPPTRSYRNLQIFAIAMGTFLGLLARFRAAVVLSTEVVDDPSFTGPLRGLSVPSKTTPRKRPLEDFQKMCGGKRCKIAVVACASSRGIDDLNFDGMALIELMIPSLLKTVETDRFAYAVYIGIDEDDKFWNDPSNKKRLKDFVKTRLSGKSLGGRVVSFPQPSEHSNQKRIPMNEIINVAYSDGADYIVRINDDTEFITNEWTSTGVDALLSMDPPNVGVVGPTCQDGNQNILTHDMVHRTHLEIFHGKYYPPVFKNWYLDDWISKVYGERRTKKLPLWEVRHHVDHHGTRYTATGTDWMVEDEVKKGRRIVDEWLKAQKTAAVKTR